MSERQEGEEVGMCTCSLRPGTESDMKGDVTYDEIKKKAQVRKGWKIADQMIGTGESTTTKREKNVHVSG